MENKILNREQLIYDALHCARVPASAALSHGLCLWKQLAERLSAVVGESGFCALYARALALTDAPLAMRQASSSLRTTETMLKALSEALNSLPPDRAQDLNGALLITYTSLLAGLIGEALTIRLLNSAWAEWSEEN